MSVIAWGLVGIALAVGATGGMMFGFHCGYIYGRFGISAHEYAKRKRQAGDGG